MKGQASQSATNMINLNLERNIYPGFPAGTPIANQLGNINLSQLSNLAINNISQLNGLALSHIAMMGMNNMNMGMNMGMGIGLGLGMPNMHGNPSMHNNAGNTTNGTANGMSMNVHNNMDLNQMQ